jgi:hypothetical protein
MGRLTSHICKNKKTKNKKNTKQLIKPVVKGFERSTDVSSSEAALASVSLFNASLLCTSCRIQPIST